MVHYYDLYAVRVYYFCDIKQKQLPWNLKVFSFHFFGTNNITVLF